MLNWPETWTGSCSLGYRGIYFDVLNVTSFECSSTYFIKFICSRLWGWCFFGCNSSPTSKLPCWCWWICFWWIYYYFYFWCCFYLLDCSVRQCSSALAICIPIIKNPSHITWTGRVKIENCIKAGPGQRPPIPHPKPKQAAPVINLQSIVVLFGLKSVCPKYEIFLYKYFITWLESYS